MIVKGGSIVRFVTCVLGRYNRMAWKKGKGGRSRVVRTTWRTGKGANVYGFGYEDYAAFFGISVEACRMKASRGDFDPMDLESIHQLRIWLDQKRMKGSGGEKG